MRTTIFFKQRCSIRRILYIAALLTFFSHPSIAQDAWCAVQVKGGVAQVKGVTTTFNYRKDTDRKSFFISNSRFSDPLEGRKEHSSSHDEYSAVKLVSHDSVVSAIRGAFPGNRMAQLIAADEDISFSVYIDEKGDVIKLDYSLDIGTSILPTEIEVLEEKLLTALQFRIEGKKYGIPAVYSGYITIEFPEVKQGEMRAVRNLEIYGIF